MNARSFVRRWAVVVVLTLAVMVAVGLWWSASSTGGWFAYAPLSDAVFTPPIIVLSTQRVVAMAMGLAGLLGLAVAAGFALGRRRRP